MSFANQRELDVEKRLRAIEREVFPEKIHDYPLPAEPEPLDGPTPHIESKAGADIERMRKQALERLSVPVVTEAKELTEPKPAKKKAKKEKTKKPE